MITIERGQHQLANCIKENGGKTLSGQQIVALEKKWGYPAILTELSLTRQNLTFQETAYQSVLNSAY
jgi:alanyl-tRNA synthetase